MKYVQSTVYFFIFLFIVLIPLNASAEMGDKAIQKWPKLFKRLQKLNTRLVNLETSEMAVLKTQLEALLRQIEEIKQTVPQLQNAVELNKSDTLTAVELNKSDTLAEVNKLESKINDLQAEVKNQVLFKIIQQKNILDKIQEDQKKLKLGLAQDIEKFEKVSRENFQTQLSQQNKILNNIREDQKKLKLALAKDIEKFAKL